MFDIVVVAIVSGTVRLRKQTGGSSWPPCIDRSIPFVSDWVSSLRCGLPSRTRMFLCSATPKCQIQRAWLQTTSFPLCGTPPFLFTAVPEPIGSCSQRELSPSLPPSPFKRLNSPSPPPPNSKSESSKWHHEQFAILPQSPVPVLVLHERVLSQRRAWGEFIAIYLGVTFYRRMICRGQLAGWASIIPWSCSSSWCG